jgi:hypothetical protein
VATATAARPSPLAVPPPSSAQPAQVAEPRLLRVTAAEGPWRDWAGAALAPCEPLPTTDATATPSAATAAAPAAAPATAPVASPPAGTARIPATPTPAARQ